jgi:hypothetical protein
MDVNDIPRQEHFARTMYSKSGRVAPTTLMISSDRHTFSLFFNFGKSGAGQSWVGPLVNDFHWLGRGSLVNN